MKEGDLSRSIQIALSLEGARLFRNNVGLFETKDGRPISTGLCKGSSDLIGWTHDGRFLAVEVKKLGSRTKKKRLEQQNNFISQVRKAGGVAFFSSNIEHAVKYYKEATI